MDYWWLPRPERTRPTPPAERPTLPAPAKAPAKSPICPCGIDRRDCEYHRCP